MTLQRFTQCKQDTGRLLLAGIEGPVSKLRITTVSQVRFPYNTNDAQEPKRKERVSRSVPSNSF